MAEPTREQLQVAFDGPEPLLNSDLWRPTEEFGTLRRAAQLLRNKLDTGYAIRKAGE
jgi:hypothetical protein